MSETIVTPRPALVSRPAPIRPPVVIRRLAQHWTNRKHAVLPEWLPAVGTPGGDLTILSASGVEHAIPRGAVVTWEHGLVEWHARRSHFGPVRILDEWPT